MHTTEMKKCGFIKNKVVEHIVKASIEKATLILHTNVTHGIDDSNETGQAWMVQNQQHLNMTYKVPFLFTKYAYCTCEWVLCGNLCKHQVAILFTCIDLTKENIIQYCGTWYGFEKKKTMTNTNSLLSSLGAQKNKKMTTNSLIVVFCRCTETKE
jgi:hypothetical protein